MKSDEISTSCTQNPNVVPAGSQSGTCTKVIPQVSCAQQRSLHLATTVFTTGLWNIPIVGGTSIARILKFFNPVIGSVLWNSTYGYFLINAVFGTSVSLINTGLAGNAPVGTSIPDGTEFNVFPPPFQSVANDNSFLAVDFTAPLYGQCTTIKVTNLNHIAPGMQVQIGTGSYYIAESLGGNVLAVCENGAGLVPGTVLFAQNSVGDNQYPVLPMSSSFVLASEADYSGPQFSLNQDNPSVSISTSLFLRNPFVGADSPVLYSVKAGFSGGFNLTDGDVQYAFAESLFLQFNNEEPFTLRDIETSEFITTAFDRSCSDQIFGNGTFLIAPNTDQVLTAFYYITNKNHEDVTANFLIDNFYVRLTAIGLIK